MFFLRSSYSHPAFREGFTDMLPQSPGIWAWGLMTGVAMVKSGLSVAESLTMALLVFAGSSQLAALPLIIAGAPAWVVLATGFCVNLRFVVFSLHLRPYLMYLPLWKRLMNGYLTADLTYVIFTRRHPHPATDDAGRAAQQAYLSGNYAVNWTAWVTSSVIGVVLANFIPQSWGLGFAGILSLTGILASLASTRMRVISAAVAAVVAVATYALPLKLNIVVAIAIATLLCLTIEKHIGPKESAA